MPYQTSPLYQDPDEFNTQIQGFLDRYLLTHEGYAGRINRHGKGQKFRMELVRGNQSLSIDLTPTAKSAFTEAFAIGFPSKKTDKSMRVLGAEIFAKTETDVEYRTPLERLGILVEDVFNEAGPRQKDLTSNFESGLTEGTQRTTGGVLFFQESVHRQDPHTILGATRSISIGFASEVRDRMTALKTIEQHMLHPYATTQEGAPDVVTTQRMKDTQFYAPVKETGVGATETIRMFSPVAQINQPSNPNEPATGLFVGNKVESVFKHKTILETTSTRETSPLMARPSPNDPNRVEFVYPQPITAKTVNQVGPSILNLSLGPEERGVPVERFPNTLIVPETPTPGELSIFRGPKKSFEEYNEIRNYAEKTYAEKLDIGNLANLRYAQVFPGIFEVDKNKEGEDVYTQVADLPGYKVAPKTNPIVAVVAYRNEQGEMVKTPVRLPGDNRERIMTGLRLDLPEVINTTTGKAERATGKFRYVDPQTGQLIESGTAKSDVIDVEETPWMEGRSMLDIVRSGNQIPVETGGVKAPSLMIDAAIEVGVGAKGFGNKFSMQVVPGVIGKGNERVGSGDIVFDLQDQNRRQTISTRARAIQAMPKNAFVQFLGGTFGGTDIGRQISLIETLFPENNKNLLGYMRDVQRRQNAVLKEFQGNPQGIDANWVVPSLARMAEANTTDNPDNPQSMWEFGFDLFKRFKKQMVVDPIGMYNRYGNANIKEPIWVSYGAVSENQRDFYLARLKQGAQRAVEEKVITKAQYEEMESNNFSNIYRFTPTTKEGLFNFEFNTPAKLTTAVGREVIQWMNKGTKFNIRELQAMRQDPDLQQWADELSGEMPESDRAWRTMQDYWRYSTPNEGEKLRPGRNRARKLSEDEINNLLSTINPEDDFTTVSNAFNHIINTTKGLIYNPKSGETWITPQVMRAVTPTEMEGGVEKSITAMGREYKEGLIQFLKGGSAQELNSPMNYFRNALDTLLTTSKDMGKQQVAKFAGDDSTGGGFVGQRGLGLNYAVVEEKDMTKYIRALAQTFGKKPSSRVDGVPFMKWARNAIEEAGGLPMAVMTNPVYSEAGGVQQMIAVTPKMARQRGLDIPLQNRVSSNMVGSLGQVVEKLFRDLDIDPAILKTLSPQKLEDLPNFLQEKVKALGGETYPEWEARLGPTASKTAGSEGQLSGWINSAFDMIKGLFNPEAQAEFFAGGKGMVELSQEAFFGAGEEAVRIKEEMGQYYREGNVLEAGARATGLWSEKGIVEGENYVSQGYAETLEQKSRPRPLLPKFLGSLSPRIVGKSHGRYEMAWQAVSKTSDDAKPELIGSSPNGVWDIGKTSYDSTSLGNWLFQSILKKDVDRDLLSPEGALFAIAPTEEAWRAGVEAIHGGADLTHTAFGMMAGEDYNIANTPLGKAIVSRASERFAPGGYKIFNPTEPGATRKSARVTARGSTINIGGTSVRVEDIGSMNGPASIVNILKKVITGVGPQGKSGVLTAEELVAVEQERQAREKTGKPADTVLDRASRELHGEEMQESVVEAGGLRVVKQKADTADYVVHPSSMPNVLRNTEYSRNAAQAYLMDYLDPSENLKKATVGKITEARAGEALQAGKDFEEFIRPTLEVASGADVFLGKPGQIKLTAEQSGIGKTMKGTPDQLWLINQWTDINDTKYALTKEGAEAKINDASMVLPQLAAYKYMMERAATLGKKEFRSFAAPLLEGKQFAPGERVQTLNRMYENALEGRTKVSVTSAYGSPENPLFANNELIHEFPEGDVNRTIEAIKNDTVTTIDSWLNPEMGVPNTKNLITTMQETIDTTPGSPAGSTIWSNLSETYRNKLTEYVASGGRSQEEPVAREYRSPRERPRYPYQGMNRPTRARARGNEGGAESSGGEPNRPATPAGNVPAGNVPSGGGPGDTGGGGGGGNARYLGPSRRKLSNEMAIMMFEKAESTYRNLTEGELGQEIMSLQDKYLEFAGQTMNVVGGWRWTGGSPLGQWEQNGQYMDTQDLRNSNQIRLGEVLGTMQAQFPDANKTFLNANQRAVNAVRGAGEILQGGVRAAEQLQAELTPEQRAMGQQFTNVLSASNVGFPKGGVAFPNALVNIVEPSKDANKEEFDRLMKSSQGMRDAFKDLSKEMDRYTELSKDEVKNKKELNRMSQETIPQGKIAARRAQALAGIALTDKDLAALAPGDISQRTEYQAKRQAYQEQLVSADQDLEQLGNADVGFGGDLRRVLGGFGIMYMKRLMSIGSAPWQAGLQQQEAYGAARNQANTLLYGAGAQPLIPILANETQRVQLTAGGGPLGSMQRAGNQFAGLTDVGASLLTGLGGMELMKFAAPMFKTIAPQLATGLSKFAGPIGLGISALSFGITQADYRANPEAPMAAGAAYFAKAHQTTPANFWTRFPALIGESIKTMSLTPEDRETSRLAGEYLTSIKSTGYMQETQVTSTGTGWKTTYSPFKQANLSKDVINTILGGLAGEGAPKEWAGINPEITNEVAGRLFTGNLTGVNITGTVAEVGAAIEAGRPVYEQANMLSMATTGKLLSAQGTVFGAQPFAKMNYMKYQNTQAGMQYAQSLPYTSAFMYGMTNKQATGYYETLGGIVGGQNEAAFTDLNQLQEAARRTGITLPVSKEAIEAFQTTNTWTPAQQVSFGQLLGRSSKVLSTADYLAQKGMNAEKVAGFGQWLISQSPETQRMYEGMINLEPIALGKYAASVGGALGQQASALSVTGYGLNGQATGLGLFSTSLNQGQITGTQTANRIWGAGGWQSSPTARGTVFGVNKETGQIYASDYQRQAAIEGGVAENMIVGGQRSIDYQRYWNSLNTQRAQIGVQFAQLALHEEYQPKFWALEDQQRALGYRQTEWGFGQQTAQMAMQTRQFGENMALQQQGMQMQRGWTQQDWAYQQNVRSMQWGWKQEDFAEQVRFMSGRERKLAERGMERETTMYNVEGDRIKTQQQRQKEAWRLEDERFELQKSQFTEQKKFQEEALEMQKRFYEEGKALELKSVALNREYQEKQIELQKASLGIQAASIEKEAELNLKAMELEDEQNRLMGNYSLLNQDATKFVETMSPFLNEFITKVENLFKDFGNKEAPLSPDERDEANGNTGPKVSYSPVSGSNIVNFLNNLTAQTLGYGKAMGGDIQPNTTYLAGEFGPELIRSKTIGSVISSADLKTAMRNRWGDSVIASGAGGARGAGTLQPINIYIANEKFGSYILDTVKKDLVIV